MDLRHRIMMSIVLVLLFGPGGAHAAFSGKVGISSLQVLPAETVSGKHPEISGAILATGAKSAGETVEAIVIASVTHPDHTVKSWKWDKVILKNAIVTSIAIPKEYDVRAPGVYRVDLSVYSKDMRPLAKLSKNFTVIEPGRPGVATAPTVSKPAAGPPPPAKAAARTSDDRHFGLGAYVNTVNTAGGATMLLWPSKYAGLQASYSMGNFTTAEGRLLLRFPLSGGINPYLGVGYASVSTERTVDTINIRTTFSDSGPTGALGIEIPLGKRWVGYAEVSGTSIDLKKEVSSGGISGTAEVKYSPVTVGFSIVYYLF